MDLWHLRHWIQYWQLRTWIDDDHCYLPINCDTWQHSRFLRCFHVPKSYSLWESHDVSNSSYKSYCPPLLWWGYEKRMHTISRAKGRLHCNQIGVCIHHAKGEIAHIVVCDGLGCICDVNQTPRHINPPDIPVMSRCRYLCPLLMDLSLFVSTVISI